MDYDTDIDVPGKKLINNSLNKKIFCNFREKCEYIDFGYVDYLDLAGITQDEQYEALSARDTRENQESVVSA